MILQMMSTAIQVTIIKHVALIIRTSAYLGSMRRCV